LSGAACDLGKSSVEHAAVEEIEGCQGEAASAAHPFGSRPQPYVSTLNLPSPAQSDKDSAVVSLYRRWKSAYLEPSCSGSESLIRTGHDDNLTVSEAHGYGMIILAMMAGEDEGAKTLFDGMYRFFVAHPSEASSHLMAWAQDFQCIDHEGRSSATDGDMDIAFGLLLADKQWGSGGTINYRQEAIQVIRAIHKFDVDDSNHYMLLGDWVTPDETVYYPATRPSDFMPGHLGAFNEADDNDSWLELRDATYSMLLAFQEKYGGETGLVSDFIVDAATDPRPADQGFLEYNDAHYAYNACRVPLRVGTHMVTSGDARAQEMLTRLNRWAEESTGGDPYQLRAGYSLDGTVLSGFEHTSFAFTAPLGVAAMVGSSSQEWLDSLWEQMTTESDGVYYSDSLQLLSMLVMSGNWWNPAQVSCPDSSG